MLRTFNSARTHLHISTHQNHMRWMFYYFCSIGKENEAHSIKLAQRSQLLSGRAKIIIQALVTKPLL